MKKATCKCITCGHVRVFYDADPIGEDGPVCEKCCGPMIPTKIEAERKTERDARAAS